MSWTDMSWADMSWADSSQEDAAEGDTSTGTAGYQVDPADIAEAATDPSTAVPVDGIDPLAALGSRRLPGRRRWPRSRRPSAPSPRSCRKARSTDHAEGPLRRAFAAVLTRTGELRGRTRMGDERLTTAAVTSKVNPCTAARAPARKETSE